MGIRHGRDALFLTTNNGFTGLCFGADYCSEHEWGIKNTIADFGVVGDKPGVDCRKMITVPTIKGVFDWYEAKKEYKGREAKRMTKKLAAGFCYYRDNRYNGSVRKYNVLEESNEVFFYGNNKLWTGWSDGSFAAFSIDPDEQAKLKELYEAIQKCDAAIWLGGGGVFSNAGLCIAIVSKLPPDVIAKWEKFDKEQANK